MDPKAAFASIAEWWHKRNAKIADNTNVRVETKAELSPLEVKRQRLETLNAEIAARIEERTALERELELANGYRGESLAPREAKATTQ